MLGGDRQAENRAGVQRELAQTLGGHRHHTGIVRTGALVAQKVQRFLLDNADITTVMDPEKE